MELKNDSIENAVSFAYSAHSAEAMYMVAKSISESANKGGGLITPVKVDGASVGLQLTALKDGTEVILTLLFLEQGRHVSPKKFMPCCPAVTKRSSRLFLRLLFLNLS